MHAGLDPDAEVGFLDAHSIEPGQRWSAALETALSRCATFVALYSPGYFLSEQCGKEWTVFSSRIDGHHGPAIVPLVWLPPRNG